MIKQRAPMLIVESIVYSILSYRDQDSRCTTIRICIDNKTCNNSSTDLTVAPPSRLSCRLFCARRLCKKLLDINDLRDHESLDLIVITEIWLNDSVPDSMVLGSASSAYSTFRKHLMEWVVGSVLL